MSLDEPHQITELQLAQRLGVSTMQIRKYLRHHGLPCISAGRGRRFDWLRALEWYLVYRVEVSGTGGSQMDVLAQKLTEIRNAAERKGKIEATERHQRLFDQEIGRLKAQIAELERSHKPQTPLRTRRRLRR